MSFVVNINDFEGPLDLMLHLIKEKELDLFDLDINILTEQYIQFIHQMDSLHLEVASEYLAELAGLIEYKSKKLLPKDESVLESEYEEDPKERLVKRLLEYQRFKEVSNALESLYTERQLQITKPMEEIAEQWLKEATVDDMDGNPYDLVKAMTRCLRRIALATPMQTKITKKEMSVDERILQIKTRYQSIKDSFSFETILEDCVDLSMCIVSFLAVLDLIRLSLLNVTVDKEETIWLRWSGQV